MHKKHSTCITEFHYDFIYKSSLFYGNKPSQLFNNAVKLYLMWPIGGAGALVMVEWWLQLTCCEVCGRWNTFLSVSYGINIDCVLSCWSQWTHLILYSVARNLLWYRWHFGEKYKNQKLIIHKLKKIELKTYERKKDNTVNWITGVGFLFFGDNKVYFGEAVTAVSCSVTCDTEISKTIFALLSANSTRDNTYKSNMNKESPK